MDGSDMVGERGRWDDTMEEAERTAKAVISDVLAWSREQDGRRRIWYCYEKCIDRLRAFVCLLARPIVNLKCGGV